MATRAYFVTMTGTGTLADPFRPVGLSGCSWVGHGLPSSGIGLVLANTSVAQHTTLLGDATVTYLPIEDAMGDVVPVTGTFGDVSATNRATCKTRMEAQHIPTQDFTLGDAIRWALQRAKRRMLLKQILGADNWTEALDSLVSAMNATKRNAINAKLTAAGLDTSGIQGTDTIREAIRKIAIQAISILRTGDE